MEQLAHGTLARHRFLLLLVGEGNAISHTTIFKFVKVVHALSAPLKRGPKLANILYAL
jgi:hypothetical protein